MTHSAATRNCSHARHHGVLDRLDIRTDAGQCSQAGAGEGVTDKGHEDIL